MRLFKCKTKIVRMRVIFFLATVSMYLAVKVTLSGPLQEVYMVHKRDKNQLETTIRSGNKKATKAATLITPSLKTTHVKKPKETTYVKAYKETTPVKTYEGATLFEPTPPPKRALKPTPRQPSCPKLLKGNAAEVNYTKQVLVNVKRKQLSDKGMIYLASNCTNLVSNRAYRTNPRSKEEADFPIAYIMTVHKSSEQFERLLRAIYEPQNLYCVHVDAKANSSFVRAITSVAKCFPNVFLATEPVTVVYAGFTRLLADIHCMQDLSKWTHHQWKYVINICGQDMPLRTNLEIVRRLKKRKGRNVIAGAVPNEKNKLRFTMVHKEVKKGDKVRVVSLNIKKPAPPQNMTIVRGSAYNFFSREFVEFVVKKPLPKALLEWSRDTFSPDEHYWASLQYHKGTPGGESELRWGSSVRAIKWKHFAPGRYAHCSGYYMRNICVYGIGDLEWLTRHNALFANKFDIETDYFAIECLEYWLKQKSEEIR